MVRGNDRNCFGADTTVPAGILGSWEGRVLGCLPGKPVGVLSFREDRGPRIRVLLVNGAAFVAVARMLQ